MSSTHTRILRTQRLVEMLEQDAPLLARRVADLAPEHQKSAKEYAARLASCARAELERLIQEDSFWNSDDFTAEPAD
ncbi:MAG: hypothetical protein JOZ80_00645 [Acidobacteriaceae bacterium]|jgi:hypothetical protein|nr:hypothetical protein [Acidobacteriaceae bacterium]